MTDVTSKHALKAMKRAVANARVRYITARRSFLVAANVAPSRSATSYQDGLALALEERRDYYNLRCHLTILLIREVVPYGGYRSVNALARRR